MSGARCPIYAGAVRVPDAAELAAWAEKARAGDRFVYCEASALVQGDTARLAAELEQAGLVVLAQSCTEAWHPGCSPRYRSSRPEIAIPT